MNSKQMAEPLVLDREGEPWKTEEDGVWVPNGHLTIGQSNSCIAFDLRNDLFLLSWLVLTDEQKKEAAR